MGPDKRERRVSAEWPLYEVFVRGKRGLNHVHVGSLHAADDQLRSQIMPVNEKYPLRDVLAECRRHAARVNRRVYVEYVMLAGVNDRYEQALALAKLLDPRIYKVNLIPYNPTGMYEGSSRAAIDVFRAVLEEHGLRATVRLTRGRDIDAACGQLAAKA